MRQSCAAPRRPERTLAAMAAGEVRLVAADAAPALPEVRHAALRRSR
jgi:hypothetical protein